MHTIHDLTSTLTDRYQTTVPEPVRRILQLHKRDKIHYTIQADGAVLISREAQEDADDPVLNQFLLFLEKDIQNNPTHINALNSDLVNSIHELTKNVDIDLDAPLSDKDE
jgi:antitoxin PrlF